MVGARLPHRRPSQLTGASFNGTMTLDAQASGVPDYQLQITDSSALRLFEHQRRHRRHRLAQLQQRLSRQRRHQFLARRRQLEGLRALQAADGPDTPGADGSDAPIRLRA